MIFPGRHSHHPELMALTVCLEAILKTDLKGEEGYGREKKI